MTAKDRHAGQVRNLWRQLWQQARCWRTWPEHPIIRRSAISWIIHRARRAGLDLSRLIVLAESNLGITLPLQEANPRP